MIIQIKGKERIKTDSKAFVLKPIQNKSRDTEEFICAYACIHSPWTDNMQGRPGEGEGTEWRG